MEAVAQSLSNQIGVIEGPPGTGKTQTILNIIANILIGGKTVAVVSNNNSAVSNISEKLTKEGLGWLCASLGRKELREKFFSEGLMAVDTKEEWKLSYERRQSIRNIVVDQVTKARTHYDHVVKLQLNRLKLTDTNHEFEVFKHDHIDDWQIIEDLADNAIIQSRELSKLIEAKDYLTSNFNTIKWYQILRWFNFWKVGIRRVNDMVDKKDLAVYAINLAIYRKTISQLEAEIKESERWLNHEDPVDIDRLKELSMSLFKDSLYTHYKDYKQEDYQLKTYKNSAWESFQKRYPIVLSSTFSLAASTSKGAIYDYLIIDEASQVNTPTAALCYGYARNVIVVGDSQQLSHIVKEDSMLIGDSLNKAYDAQKFSALASLKELYKKDLPVTMLREHYRCHPQIIDFCNRRFYDNEMVIMSKANPEFPYRLIYVEEGSLTRPKEGSVINFRQVQETLDYVKKIVADGSKENEVGIIAPYKAHTVAIARQLGASLVESDTVHKYQGREKDVIIYNTVQNQITDFNNNPNLINVAISRAKNRFVVVAPESIKKQQDSNLASLINYIEYRDPEFKYTSHSKYSSIFDVLYQQNDKYRDVLQKKKGKESPAETIFRRLVDQVLSEKRKELSWGFKQEYYLIDLFKKTADIGSLSQEEWNYALNGAKIDFLVFDFMANKPVLAIEIDGRYHKQKDQQRKDAMKDHILTVMGIRHCRFSTDSVRGMEEEKLRQELNNAYLERNK